MVSMVPPRVRFSLLRKYHDLRPRARKNARTVGRRVLTVQRGGVARGPVGRQQRDVRLGEKAPADERDDPAVLGRADEPARSLDDASHARDQVGVLEAALVAVVEVLLEQLALGADLGQRRRDDHDLGEHLPWIVHALGEDAAEDRQEQDGLVVATQAGKHLAGAACRSRPPSEPRSGDPAPPGGRPPPAEKRRRERAPAHCGRPGQAPRPARRCGRTSAGGHGRWCPPRPRRRSGGSHVGTVRAGRGCRSGRRSNPRRSL